jgi:triacylglycerol lipase
MFPSASSSSFCLAIARDLAAVSALAYKSAEEIQDAAYKAGATQFQFIESRATDTQCFVAAGYAGNVCRITVAFRGTEKIQDWITDARFHRVPMDGQSVHAGFAAAINSVWAELIDVINRFRDGWLEPQIYITGHSLGGALAQLCAWQLINHSISITGVYVFGAPRVGDKAFAANYDFFLRGRTFRLVNRQDIVTRLPGVLAGFRHAGTEVFFDSFGDTRMDYPWWRKIPSDIYGLAAELDPVLPFCSVAATPLKNHFMAAYLSRLSILNPQPSTN